MRYIILLIIIIFSNSCKECSCDMARFDLPQNLVLVNQSKKDTIYFNTNNIIGKDFEKTPFAPTPKVLVDSLDKLINSGYRAIYTYQPTITRLVNCIDCQQVLKYSPTNSCKEYDCK